MDRASLLRRAATFAPALIVALFGLLTFIALRSERLAAARVAKAHAVIDAYEAILADVRNAQNGQRGFVITGDAAYLEPYERARNEIGRHRAELRRLVAGDTGHVNDVGRIDTLASEALQMYEATVETRRTRGAAAALAKIEQGEGELLKVRLRAIIEKGIARETDLLAEASREQERRATITATVVLLGTLLAALLGFLLNASLARYAKREERQNAELRVVNERLQEQQEELEASTAELEMSAADLEQATEALRHNEARMRGMIEHAFDIVALTGEDGRLNFVSPSVTRVLGFEAAQAIGNDPREFVHPDDRRDAKRKMIAALRAPEQPISGIARVRTADDSWRALTYTIMNLLNDRAVQGMVINARDVTESQRLEEQLLQSQKMEAVGRLAGGIAHDFNNLITTIKGNVTFALDELGADHTAVEDLQTVNDAADRAASLTKQLLAFSRRQAMQPRTVDVGSVVADFDRMIKRVIGEEIEVRARLPAEPQYARVDPGQVQQVLMNLTVNARDAMPQGGTVTIEVRRELRDEVWPGETSIAIGGYVMIAVSDTGIGMSRDVRERIFEPFFTTKEAGKGTGLGLSTVYGIVKQSGGHLYVYSEPGQGTTFKIYFPLADAETMVNVQQPSEREERGGTETILVVEDEPAVRSLAVRALRAKGYEVLEARNGREALDVLANNGKVQLLLSDMIMPEMRGQQLVEIVTQKYPDMRVILMSGYTDTDMGELPAAARYIEKPFTIAALTRIVRETLDNA